MNDPASLIALAGGLAWASGIRLYMALFVAGCFSRFGLIELPQSLLVLESTWVIVASGVLFAVEFLADKIPGIDSAWDAVQTFIRIPAGAVLSAATFAEMDPALVTVAAMLGGTVAAGAHFAKAGSRAVINTSPEPFSNWAASFTEEALVVCGLLAAFFNPALLFVLLALFLFSIIWLMPKLLRSMRWFIKRLSA